MLFMSVNELRRVDLMTKRLYELDDCDAAQVRAILLTHAEMQDHRCIDTMSIMGRLTRDEPIDAATTIIDLQGQVDTFEDDCDNLKRIADVFINA
jgi:hypothetical protein